MRFDSSKIDLAVGQQHTMELFIEPLEAANYNFITWRSSDNSVAQVSQTGVITAIYTGSCTITASYLDVKAEVEVTVAPIAMSLNFAKGVIYYLGNKAMIMRLLSDGYTIEPNGNILGAGYYLNMDIRTQESVSSVPVGVFRASSSEVEPNIYLRGRIVEQNGSSYATGSYLGFVSIGSSSVMLVDSGDFHISNDSINYNIGAIFKCSRNETIEIDYKGDILFFDRSQGGGDTLHFTSQISDIEPLGDTYNINNNIFRVKYADENNNILQLEMVAPISATSLPVGNYRLNGQLELFSLVPSDVTNGKGTLLIKNDIPTEVLYGNVRVSKDNNNNFSIEISLIGASNEVINR